MTTRPDLARRWPISGDNAAIGFTTGYRYVQSDSDDEGKSSSNTIFFGVSRDFTILP